MAERRAGRRRPDHDEPAEQEREPISDEDEEEDEAADRPRPSRRRRGGGLTAGQVAQEGLRQIAELTGKPSEGVTGVEPAEDGWLVGVEVVEDRRIPSSTDILATYEIEIGPDGDLVSYRRVRRYARGRGDSEDS